MDSMSVIPEYHRRTWEKNIYDISGIDWVMRWRRMERQWSVPGRWATKQPVADAKNSDLRRIEKKVKFILHIFSDMVNQ